VALPPLRLRPEEAGPGTPPQVGSPVAWWWVPGRPRPLQVRDLLVMGIDLERNPFRPPDCDQIGGQALCSNRRPPLMNPGQPESDGRDRQRLGMGAGGKGGGL